MVKKIESFRENMDMGFAGLAAAAANVGFGEAEDGFGSSASRARAAFQWGGTVFALILLILNRAGRRSAMQSNFLVLYLFTSFPTVLFKILRGQFGYWVSFLAVAANLFFPRTVPVSRFLLFVITPVWVANGLRDSIVGCIFCLILGVSLVITEIRGIGGFCNCQCNFHCFAYCLCIGFIFFFTILYLCSETW